MPHEISLETAVTMTTLYRTSLQTVLNPGYPNILAKCETFDRAALNTLLAQDGCTAVRIYYGMSTDLNVHAILVGVNKDNEDMLPGGPVVAELFEEAARCPEDCPPPSPLNDL